MKDNWTRRHFVKTFGGAGAVLALSPLVSWTNILDELDPRVPGIVNRTFGIDAHNHVDVPLGKDEFPAPKVDLKLDMQKSGLAAIAMTFAVDYVNLTYKGQAYERFLTGLDRMDDLLKENNVKRVFSAKDLEISHKHKQPVVIQSVEGGHFLEGNIERLQEAYSRGLRHLGLLHDHDASVLLGDVYTNEPKDGLTQFGKDVIIECNRLGILVDLAHCDNNTINKALKVSQKPIIISHTGLNTRLGTSANDQAMGHSAFFFPRLISPQQAKIVANAGGVIGVWTHLADTPLQYAENIRAMADVVGIDHVCIGTDTKLTTPYHPLRKQDDRLNSDNNHHQEPPHQEKNQKPRAGERTNNAWEGQTKGFYYVVVDALLKTGFTIDDIAKIGGGNYLRLFKEAIGS